MSYQEGEAGPLLTAQSAGSLHRSKIQVHKGNAVRTVARPGYFIYDISSGSGIQTDCGESGWMLKFGWKCARS